MTNKINFDDLIDRKNTHSVKWDKYGDSEILPLWVADTDFAVAPQITDALQRRIKHGVFGYAHAPEKLSGLIVERMARLYDWQIKAEWLVFLPCVVSGLHMASRCNGSSQSKVLIPQVIYPPIAQTPHLSNRKGVQIPMLERHNRWIIDFDFLEQKDDIDGALLLFCNPQNPGGAVYTKNELQRLAEIAKDKNLSICSDEIHCDLILQQGLRHIPVASLNDEIANSSITLMAPSKTFNLAGLGFAFAIIPNRDLRRGFRKAGEGIVPYPNLMGYVAAEAAYAYADDWNSQQLDYLRANRDYLMQEINNIRGLKLDLVESTYLAWIDISELGLENPSAFFEKAGVGMSAGKEFGDKRFMRLNFACPRSLLEEAIKRMSIAISDY